MSNQYTCVPCLQVWADGDEDEEVLGMVVRTGQSHCLCKHMWMHDTTLGTAN